MQNTNHLDSFHTLLSKYTLISFFSIWKQNSGGCRQQIIFVTLETVACGYISTGISHERQRFLWDVFVLCVLVYFYAFWTSHKKPISYEDVFFLSWLLCWWSECEPRDITLQSHWPAQCFHEGQPAAPPLIWDQGVHVLVSMQKSRVNDF